MKRPSKFPAIELAGIREEDAARYVGLDVDLIRMMLAQGIAPQLAGRGRSRRWRVSELDEWTAEERATIAWVEALRAAGRVPSVSVAE